MAVVQRRPEQLWDIKMGSTVAIQERELLGPDPDNQGWWDYIKDLPNTNQSLPIPQQQFRPPIMDNEGNHLQYAQTLLQTEHQYW